MWGEPVEARVGSVQIVVGPPCVDKLPGPTQGREQMLVEAFVTQPPVERLDEPVLHRLARCDVVPFNTTVLLPGEDRIGGQLGAVVAHHHAGIAPTLGDGVKLARHPFAGQRGVDHRRQALPAEVVDHTQDAEASAVAQRVGNKVEAPALVAVLRDRHRRPGSQSSLAATPPAHRKPLFLVEPIQLLAVHRHPLALQQ